jgi:hypothetical protein
MPERCLDQAVARFVAGLRPRPPLEDPRALAGRIATLDPWQEELVGSDAQQLLMLCSRQSGKSFIAALLTVLTLVHEPGALVLLVAPALRQAQELFRVVKRMLVDLGDQAPPLRQESALSLELTTGGRVVVVPGTFDGRTIRGYSRVRLLVLDEAARIADPIYYSVRPMVAVGQGRIVALSSPAGSRGWFWHEATKGSADWHRVTVPATACPRLSRQWLAAERRRIGTWWFDQEYLCRFLDAQDAVFSSTAIAAAADSRVTPLYLFSRPPAA